MTATYDLQLSALHPPLKVGFRFGLVFLIDPEDRRKELMLGQPKWKFNHESRMHDIFTAFLFC
jgi:hypothetical protein